MFVARLCAQDAAQAAKPNVHARPLDNSFTAVWHPIGPNTVSSLSFGSLSGRVLSLAVDPNDTTGNTVYLGTAGGGVWKSLNAAGAAPSVTFAPLTDTLGVFGSGYKAIPSLFIGALAVQPAVNPVVLAGTGDPNNNTDSYYGEGILRSTDGGVTWSLIQLANDLPNAIEAFNGLSAAGFAWSTGTPSLVVAAFTTSPLADAVQATQSSSVPGLYYSTDAGATWHMGTVYDGASIVQQPQPLGTASGNAATSVVWNPKRKMFFAVLRAHGYYSSTDGMTWKRLGVQPGSAITTANCPVGTNGMGKSTCPVYRGTLAVQPVTGDTYAWTVDSSSRDQGLWQDLCALNSSGACANVAPAFANRVDHGDFDTSSTTIAGGIGTLSLLANPQPGNGTALFAGAGDLYRCTLAFGETACIFRNTTNALSSCTTPAQVAPGQHALSALPQASGATGLLLGNDGGLWRSLDDVNVSGTTCSASDASHFDNLNAAVGSGGSIADVVGFAQDPSAPPIVIAGLGSNGTAATSSASAATWLQLSAGEGGFPHIDQITPTNWYAAIGSGVNLKQCSAGSACAATDFVPLATISAAQVGNDASLIHAPSLLDPSQTSNVLFGTCRVWRGPGGSGDMWGAANAISTPMAGTAPCTSASPFIRSLAAGGPSAASADTQHSGSTVIYAGMAGLLDGGGTLGGHLFVTTAANTASSSTRWTDASYGTVTNDTYNGGVFNPSGYSVSSVFVDPHDPTGATVYATIMGFVGPHLYRSTDFGSHWLNLSSNLPSAPANSVVVDPNDANTVYVALDSGVYATAAISTCPTANCWAILGSGLPNAPVTQLRAGAQLPTGGGLLGMLRASTYGRGIWQTPLLAATPIAAPALTASPISLAFASQQVGTQSDAQSIAFTSSGNAPVSITSLTLPQGFAETDTCAGQTLAVGAECSAQVRFAPTTVGSAAGSLTAFANIAGGQVTVALTGSGTAPASIVLTPSSLTFAATLVQQTSAAQNISIANTGGVAATLQNPTISGDFSITANTCGATLAPQTACAISIVFKPTDKGTRSGALALVDSVGTQIASLTGVGNSPATDTLNSTSLSFTQQAVGTTSATQQVMLTNAGDVPLLSTSVSITGDFVATNNCGTSLPGHGTCAVLVAFVPSSVGTRSGTLTITDQFRSQTVTLSGIAVAPAGVSLTPSSLTFAGTGVGLSAPAQAITLTNNGGLPLNISKQTISGDFAIAVSTCGSTLGVNAACSMTVVFTPTAAGNRPGVLTLTDDAPSGAQTVTLTGTGIDFSFAPSGASSQTVTSGTSATYAMLLTSAASLNGNISFACSGAPAHSVCSVNPSTANLGASTTIIATVQTGLSTAKVEPRPAPWWRGGNGLITLAILVPLCCFGRRRSVRALMSAAIFCSLLWMAGCGTPRTIPGSGGTIAPSTPTPAGTYTLTVTGTAAGISHSVLLTLIVQ